MWNVHATMRSIYTWLMQICISLRPEKLNLLEDKDMGETSIRSRDGMWEKDELDEVHWEGHISGTLNASEICLSCGWGGGHLMCKCWNDFEDIITPGVYWINGINVHMRWSIRSMYADLSTNAYRRRSICGSHADLSTNAHRRRSIHGGHTDLPMNAHRRRSIRGSHTDLSMIAHRRRSIRGGHTDLSTNAHRRRSIHDIRTDPSTNAHRWRSIRGICIDEILRYFH